MAVFAGARLRDNNAFGTITDNPLTAGAVTLNSAGLANVSAVSGNHVALVLDPLRTAGAPEIIIVTAHTGAATSATITRGAYGTVARSHAAGVLWVLAATADDLIRICTSATRPADVYKGQLIYETDTDSYKGHNGTAWEHGLTLGAWTVWVPTLTNLTLGAGSSLAAYYKIGRQVTYRWRFTLAAGSAVGSAPSFTLPVAPSAGLTNVDSVGDAKLADTGTSDYRGQAWLVSGSTVKVVVQRSDGTYSNFADITATVPHTWASTDAISVSGTYESAA